jgi:acyl-CoA synthetase (AMP-forming)/AMP-acid ligase II
MDIYAGCAKGGQIVVPIMFRLAPPDIEYIVNHAECKGIIVEQPFVEMVNGIRDKLSVPENTNEASRK